MFYIVLNNIRSGWNVGSIFRTCDALGFSLILVGYTITPVSKNLKIINKTAIGAQETVDWKHYWNPTEVFESYKEDLHISIEISKNSQNIFDFCLEQKKLLKEFDSKKNIFLWFGNEIHGLSQEIVDKTSYELHLPMHGKKESLNIASSVCSVGYLFRFLDCLD